MKATTPRSDLSKLYTSNSTANSITSPSATATEPSGDGIFNLGNTGGDDGVFNYAHLAFIGAGSADNTANAMIVGWRKIGSLWIPFPLLGLDLTLGTATGVDGYDVDDSDRFADTISVTSGKDYTTAYEILSKGDDTIASVKLDVIGFDKLQVLTNRNSSATNVNALCAGF